MRSSPLISIITPSLNRADLIENTIQSILSQNYSNFEHIIVDGQSTDTTMDILRKYKHLKTYSFKCTTSEAQNFGIDVSKGKIIGFINSDDYLLPGVFKELERFFFNFKNVDIFTGSFLIKEKEKIIYKAPLQHNILDLETLAYGAPGINSTFFKRGVFNTFGKFRNDFQIVFDRAIIAELILGGAKSVSIPKYFLVYLKHKGSNTINNKGRLNDVIIREHLRLSHELILKSKQKNVNEFFYLWQAWERIKEVLLFLKKKRFREASLKIYGFFNEGRKSLFFLKSLYFYFKRKVRLRTRAIFGK